MTFDIIASAESWIPFARFQQQLMIRTASSLALTLNEFYALLVIADTEGTSPGELAAELNLSSGAITSLVDRLEDSGHARRVAVDADRRRLRVELTVEGLATIESVQADWARELGAVIVKRPHQRPPASASDNEC